MTDAEAEAVLRALRPRLQWRPTGNPVYLASETGNDGKNYGIRTLVKMAEREHACLKRCHRSDGFDDGPYCTTMDEAKVARERHYATGKWE